MLYTSSRRTELAFVVGAVVLLASPLRCQTVAAQQGATASGGASSAGPGASAQAQPLSGTTSPYPVGLPGRGVPLTLRDAGGSPYPAPGAGFGLSWLGATGLIRTPTADITADGDVRLAGFPHTALSNWDSRLVGSHNTMSISLGFLPGVELGATLGDDSTAEGRDLAGNLKVQLLREGPRQPAFAVGLAELGKGPAIAVAFHTYSYAVATKSIPRTPVRVTLGVRHQYDTQPFGGLEVGFARNASLSRLRG